MATTYLTQTDPNKKDQIGFDPAAMNNWIDYVGALGQAHGQLSGMNNLENNSLATTGHALSLIDYNNFGNVLAATQDPRSVASQIIAGTYKPAVAASPEVAASTTTAGTTTGGTTAGTTTTGGTTAAAPPAAISPDAGLNAMARNLTPAEMAQLQAQGPWGVAGGLHFTTTGTQQNTEGGVEQDPNATAGIEADAGNVNGISGGWKNLYNADGTFDKQQLDPGASGFDKAFDAAVQMGLAAAFGGVAMGAAGIGGAAADGSLAVQGDSINALDAQTGVGYGSEASGGSMLTGPTSVDANYSLLTGTNTVPTGDTVLEGNAGQGVNFAANSGTGLQMPTTPNLDAMGGGQGLTTTGAQTLGDQGSFINAAENQVANAGQQTISQSGVYTPEHPYTPDLGDPNSLINGGTAGVTPTATSPWDSIKSFFTGSGTGGITTLTSALQAGATLGGLLTTSKAPSTLAPSFTPPQPQTGPGDYTSASAQGGASGSMAGVAGTLLTSKDTFGYGKSMLT